MSQDTKKTAAAKAAEEKAKAAEAKAKAEAEAKPEAEAETTPATESEAPSDAQDKPAEGQKTDQTPPAAEKAEPSQKTAGPEVPGLKAVSAWVGEKRIATWQSAALLRARGWTDDKKVTEDDFNKALAAAMSRPQGGANGRRN